MDDSEFQRMPNPFSPFAQDQAHRRRNLFATMKLLLAAVALFAIAAASQAYLHRAKLASLIHDFAQGSKTEKLGRLQQLHESGDGGIPGLVQAVGDPDPDVSTQAVALLVDANQRWNALPTQQQRSRQKAFAEALFRLVQRLEDPRDPRFERAQSLARQTLSHWPVVPTADDTVDRETEEGIRTTLAKVLRRGQTDASQTDQTPPVEDPPLPIELAGTQAASWTDWPPTPLTPKLYRRPVATLDVADQPEVMLGQIDQPDVDERSSDASPASEPDEARIVKPTYRAAATLNEQPMRVPGGTTATTAYWMSQLASPSRHVRLRAVTELSRRGDVESLEALRDHLVNETDHGVAFRIRNVLDPSTASPKSAN